LIVRCCAVTPIDIYARLRLSQLFINIMHPLSIRLLLPASIKSRMLKNPLPFRTSPSSLSLLWYSVTSFSPPLVEKEWSRERNSAPRANLSILTFIYLFIMSKSTPPHHYAPLSEDTRPITARSAPSPQLVVLNAVCLLRWFLVGTFFSLETF